MGDLESPIPSEKPEAEKETTEEVLDDGVALGEPVIEQLEDNVSSFGDVFEGVKDAKFRRLTLNTPKILMLVYERLGLMGKVLEMQGRIMEEQTRLLEAMRRERADRP